MKSLLALSLLSGLLFASCTKANPCSSSDECPDGHSCNIEEAVCEPESVEPPPAAADAGITCDPSDGLCLSAIPDDWVGPVVQHSASAGEELTPCSGAYGVEVATKFSDLEGTGSCTCACGDATGLGCTGATIAGWDSPDGLCELNQCGASSSGGGSCITSSRTLEASVGGDCTLIDGLDGGAASIRATSFGNLEGGSCAAPSVASDFTAAFASQHGFCLAERAEECGPDETCAPAPPEDAPVCIVQEGEHSCPEGDFSERSIVYASIDDARSCDAGSCSCDAPTGSCRGTIELRTGNEFGCGGLLAILKPGSGPFATGENRCDDADDVTYAQFFPDLEGRSCSASGEGGITGELRGAEPMTVCCTAP